MPSTRDWSDADVAALRRAADRVERELEPARTAGLVDVGDGVRLHAFETGAGRPLVLVHGWGTNGRVWRYQLAGLAGEHHVIALDMRSHGASPPAEEPTTAALARDVKGFLDTRGLAEDAVIVGWSMGGLVIMSYLQQFGAHRLRGIGIVDVSPRLREGEGWGIGEGVGKEIGEGIDRWRSIWPAERDTVARELNTTGFARPDEMRDELAFLMELSAQADPATAMDILVDLFAHDYRESLREVTVPALLLRRPQHLDHAPRRRVHGGDAACVAARALRGGRTRPDAGGARALQPCRGRVREVNLEEGRCHCRGGVPLSRRRSSPPSPSP